jgi:signal transduction histidine kinase
VGIYNVDEAEQFVKNLKRSDNWISNDELLQKLNASHKIILENNREDLLSYVTINLALYYIDLGDYGQAWLHAEEARQFAESTYQPLQLCSALSLQYRIHLYLGNFDKGQEILNEQLNLAIKNNDPTMLHYSYQNQAFQFHLQNMKDECIEAFEKTIYYSLKEKNPYYIAMTHTNFAGYLLEFNELSRAKKILKKGIKIALENKFNKPLSLAYANLGVLYQKLDKYRKAEQYFKESINICRTQKNFVEEVQITILLAESLVLQGKLIQAELLLLNTLKYSEQNQSRNNLHIIFKNLCDLNQLKGNYKEALEWHKKFKGVQDELYNIETGKRIKNLEVIQKVNLLKIDRDNAQAMSNIKHDFLANMSHEIRTPINSILGVCYLLKQQPLDIIQQNYVTRLQTSGEILLGIINDVLDISKIEAGKMELNKESFSLNDLIKGVYESMEPRANEKKINFILNDKTKNFIVLGDAIRLQQVFLNILSNAIKFTENGSVKFIISSKNKGIENQTVNFTIKDTGIGISKSNISKLFVRYEQAHDSIKNKFGGTGLGLSISKKIIELMNGSIEIKSQPNKGTTILINIPFEFLSHQVIANKNKEYTVRLSTTELKNLE